MEKRFKLLNRVIVYGFFVTGVALLFHGTGRISTMLTAFGSFIASLLIAYFLKIKGIDDKYWFFANLALFGNILGEVFLYYSGLLIYDKILHLVLGFLLSMIVYEYYRDNSNLKKDSVLITVIGLLALWEVYEFTLDSFLGFQGQGVLRNGIFLQSPINDTMFDIIWGAIGSLSYLFFKKEKIDVALKKDVRVIKKKVKKMKKIAEVKSNEIQLSKLIKDLLIK